MRKIFDIKIVDKNNAQRFVIIRTCYKNLETAVARRDYEQWKYGNAYSVQIWENERG